jgi:hypothetical protein
MKNYEMKIEKAEVEKRERFYKVIFTPDTNYGNISIKTYTKKEAFAKYYEIKNIVYDTRPGRLKVFEYRLDETGNYTESYVCNCRTGKKVDAIAIFNNIDKELQQISNIYNGPRMEREKELQSKEELNIIHGVEYLDLSLLSDAEKIAILDKIQIASSLRRQAKNNKQDYKDIADELVKMKAALKCVERKLNDNLMFRRNSVDSNNTKKPGCRVAIEMYLESLGLDPKNYLEN